MDFLFTFLFFLIALLRVSVSIYIFISSYMHKRTKGYIVGVFSYIFPIVALVIYKKYIVKLYVETKDDVSNETI